MREREVAVLIAQCKSNREIADISVLLFQNSRVFHDDSISSLGYTLRVSQATILLLASY